MHFTSLNTGVQRRRIFMKLASNVWEGEPTVTGEISFISSERGTLIVWGESGGETKSPEKKELPLLRKNPPLSRNEYLSRRLLGPRLSLILEVLISEGKTGRYKGWFFFPPLHLCWWRDLRSIQLLRRCPATPDDFFSPARRQGGVLTSRIDRRDADAASLPPLSALPQYFRQCQKYRGVGVEFTLPPFFPLSFSFACSLSDVFFLFTFDLEVTRGPRDCHVGNTIEVP